MTVVDSCAAVARWLTGTAVPPAPEAAADRLAESYPPASPGTAVRYAAVRTRSDGRVTYVAGPFRSKAAATAHADAEGWAYFTVAPHQARPPWLDPGQP